MVKKLIKKLLAPIIREVLQEQINEQAQASQCLNDKVQDALLKAVNSVNCPKLD